MLRYAQTGEGPDLLLIHGFPNDMDTWLPVLPALAAHYRVTRINLPGTNGSTPMPQGSESLEYMAAEILRLLGSLGVSNTLLAGHSMGGYTALTLHALAPHMVRGLALVHSLAAADTEEKKKARQKSIRLLRNGPEGKRLFLTAMAQNLFGLKDSAALRKQVVAAGMQLSANALAAFYTAIMQRSDKRPILGSLRCPIAYICGTEDSATPYALALSECLLPPVCTLHTLRGAGHMSMLEDPDWLAAHLLQFLDYCSV